MTPPPTHATPEAGSNDKEATEVEPNEALASTGAADVELQGATVTRLSSCTSISSQEGESAIAGSDGPSPSGGDSKRNGEYAGSSLGVADGGVLSLDLPVRQHSQDSEVVRAIYGGRSTDVQEVLCRMEHSPTVRGLRAGSYRGLTPIMHAALAGNTEVFSTVLTTLEATLTREQIDNRHDCRLKRIAEIERYLLNQLEPLKVALTAITYPGGDSLVLAAAEGGNGTIFSKAVELLGGEVLKVTVRRHPFGRELLTDAARTGGLKIFADVRTVLGTRLTEKKAIDMIGHQGENSLSILTASVKGGNRHIVGAWAEVLAQKLSVQKMTQACRDSFSTCAKNLETRQASHEGVPPRDILAGMSVLFAYGAVASQRHLVSLAKAFPLNLKDCFLGAVSLVDNPFVPGMTLSVALDGAAPKAREGQQVLVSLQNDVDMLLLEVLERLPQSIKTFPKGLHGCAEVFEPETTQLRPIDFEGPLKLALKERQFTETFCAAPLVFDYLCHKFVLGLPDIRDSENVVDSVGQSRGRHVSAGAGNDEHYLYRHNLVAGTNLGKFMQGIRQPLTSTRRGVWNLWRWQRGFSGTSLPGLQFAAIGILAKPAAYFKVPVMRMAMDFIVYVVVLGVYTNVILSGSTSAVNRFSVGEVRMEDPTNSEIFLAVYVTAAVYIEMAEICMGMQEYWQDKWNWLDAFALGLLASGLYIRIDETDIVYGRALYALSAPLMFSRVLFFAQIFPRQGLVIQMIALMIGELAQFGVVVLTIMMGFTVGFVAIFDEFNQSFGEVWVRVFKLMLGEVDVFDDNEFDNKIYEYVVRLMLILYLIVMAVMLLNLLIAVLSTEHARVDEKKDREFGVSKVRMVKHYSSTVDNGSVPAPFNLIQIAIWVPFRALDLCFKWNTYGTAKRAVGVVAFWLITGPVTIVLAWSLWIISTPYALTRTWKGTRYNATSLAPGVLRCCAVVPLHLFVVPLVLVTLWVLSGVVGVATAAKAMVTAARQTMPSPLHKIDAANDEYLASHNKRDDISVSELLMNTPGAQGVADIWKSIGDPTTNPSLLRDEQRRSATVADLKLLRTALQASSEDQTADLRFRLESVEQSVEGIIEAKMAEISEKLDDLVKKFQ